MRTVMLAAMSLWALVAGCASTTTQLVVTVDSDLEASELACVRVTVSRLGEPAGTPVLFAIPADAQFPFSFGVTQPGGDSSRRVEVTAEALSACSESGAALVRTTTRTGFLRSQSLALPLFLATSCSGVVCDPDDVCGLGSCAPIESVDPGSLEPSTFGGGSSAFGGTTSTVIVP